MSNVLFKPSELNFDCMLSVVLAGQIERFFHQNVRGLYGCLDHFALNVCLPDGITLSLCSNPNYILSYKENNMHLLASGLKKDLSGLPVIPWRMQVGQNDAKRMNSYISFKEGVHRLYSGMSFIKKYADVTINVAVATKDRDPNHALAFLNSAEQILNLGVYAYDVFLPYLNTLSPLVLPRLNEEVILCDGAYNELDRLSKQWSDYSLFTSYQL